MNAATFSRALLRRLLRASFLSMISIHRNRRPERDCPGSAFRGNRAGRQSANDFESRFTGRPSAAPVFTRPDVQSLMSTLLSSPTAESFRSAEPETTSTIAGVPVPEWWRRERERADMEVAMTATPLSDILLGPHSANATLPDDSRSAQAGTARLDQGGRDADVAAPPLVDLQTTPSSAEPSSTRTLTNAQLAAYVARARGQIAVGDIAGARLLLEPAAAQDDMDALFALAETYDPLMLRRWRVIGPVRMTRWHERSTKRPLNGAMPKQPRVSLPNLDSLALSPRARILSQVVKSAPLAVQLQHAHRTAPLYLLRTVILDCSGNPQSSWRRVNSRPRPSSKPKLKQTVTPDARNGIPSHMALRSSTAWASSWLVEIPKGRPGPSREW